MVYRLSPHNLLTVEQDTVVDERSGCIDGFPKLGLACNHFEMNSFAHADDANYKFVRDQLVKLAEAARSLVTTRFKSGQLLKIFDVSKLKID